MEMNEKVSGSFTLEATFIVSLTILLIFGFMYAGLYLREECIFHSLVEMRVLRAKRSLEEAIDSEGHMEPERIPEMPILQINPKIDLEDALTLAREIAKELGTGWSLLDPNPITVIDYKNKVGIEYYNAFKRGIPLFYKNTWVYSESFSETELVLNMEPEDFLRICRGIL